MNSALSKRRRCEEAISCLCFVMFVFSLVLELVERFMSVKLASYSYSFSASSYELPQNVYIGRSHHAEHEYDIRFALGQTV